MSGIKVKKFKTNNAVQWHWPIQVGHIPSTHSKTLISGIKNTHWGSRLIQTFEFSKGRRQCNFLIHVGDLKSAIHQLQDFQYSLQADVVIIFCDANTDLNAVSPVMVDAIINMAGCNGLMLLPGVDEKAGWCDELVFQLAHNNSIKTAIENFNSEGLFYLTTTLEEVSNLHHYAQKLIRNLKALSKDLSQVKLRDGSLVGTRELANKLKQDLPNFKFEHESDEASTIADISRSVSTNVSSTVVNEGMPSSKITRSNVDNPRYLQCKVENKQGDTVFKLLKISNSYKFNVRIGPADSQWLQSGKKAPVEALFKTTMTEQELLIVFRSNLSDSIQKGTIVLPPLGASKPVIFDLIIDDLTKLEEGQELIVELSAYHKNRLLQTAIVSAYFVEDPDSINALPFVRMETMASPRVLLDNLDDRTEFATSIRYENENGDARIQANTASSLSYKLEKGLDDLLKDIKSVIEEAVIHNDEYPEDLMDENNTFLINKLAHKGRQLYDNYLKDIIDFEGPIQIISGSHGYIPLEFIYTYPAPELNAEMCPKAIEALEKGQCENCMDKSKSPAPYICPFGFLGFSKVIERHDIDHKSERLNNSDFVVYSEPSNSRRPIPLLVNTIFGSAKRVESRSAGMIKKVSDAIKASTTAIKVARTWDEWKEHVDKENADSLVLMVHTEMNKVVDTEQMEIGDNNFTLKTYINEDYVDPSRKEPAPVVILIGCQTQDTEAAVFDFTNQFKNQGAAVVLSNFTKIRGRQAGPIVIKLFEFLEAQKGNEFRFGEIMLKLRQYLLSKGVIVSFALVAHGDADWKIKL